MKRTTKLTIETERVVVIRQGHGERQNLGARRGRCEDCQEVVRRLTADEAARLARVSARAIYRLVEAAKIHFTETDEGLLLICFNSLSDRLLQADARRITGNSNGEGENHESQK